MKDVPLIDASGMHALKEFYLHCQKTGASLLLASVRPEVAKDLLKFKLIGKEAFFHSVDAALEKAQQLTGRSEV
jgi:SulP family sulfate permease